MASQNSIIDMENLMAKQVQVLEKICEVENKKSASLDQEDFDRAIEIQSLSDKLFIYSKKINSDLISLASSIDLKSIPMVERESLNLKQDQIRKLSGIAAELSDKNREKVQSAMKKMMEKKEHVQTGKKALASYGIALNKTPSILGSDSKL